MPSDTGAIALPPIYHVGVVVKDIDKTTKFLSSMWGLGPWQIIESTLNKEELMIGEPCSVKLAGAKLGPIILELLQPLEGKSVWSEFLETHGEGLHHIAYGVSNWDEIVPKLQEQGGKMIAGGIAPNGKRWGYFHTEPGGIIIEFEELSDEGKSTITFES